MDIGKRIRGIREERGLTQREVARRAGLTPSGVGFIEHGQTRNPSAETVVGIARALGVPVEELLEEPALAAGKAEAPQETGSEERQRPSLDQVRAVFAPFADGLDHYCARWEAKLPNLQGTREEVADFVADLVDFRAMIMRVFEEEMHAIAAALDLGNRYGESGLPRDMAVGFTQGELAEHSLMSKALNRYHALAYALAESINDEKIAESMRQVLVEAGV